MNENESLYEIVIVGAGPAGISLAVEAQKFGISAEKVITLERQDNHSWSIRKFYPESKLVTANYKGNDAGCTGSMCLSDSTKDETLAYLENTIKEHQLNVLYNQNVDEIKKLSNSQYVVCSGNECFVTKTIAIAIGVLGKPNRPDYKIPAQINSRVLFDVTSVNLKGQRILVVGGGDSASEYTHFLAQGNNDITLCYRRENFSRMNEVNKKQLIALEEKRKCKLYMQTDIEAISLAKDEKSVEVQFTQRNAEVFDYIVYALGGTTPKNFLSSIGIKMSKEGPSVTDFFESEQEGIFLLGDLSAGKGGGSINLAFNNSHKAMNEFCRMYLDCPLPSFSN